MIYIRIRYLLILFFMAIGILIHYQVGIENAWYCYVASILLYLSYYIFGTVGPAFAKLQQGKLEEAEKLINLTRRPDFLLRRHRAYYHFTRGMIALQKKNLAPGEMHLKAALDTGLRSDNDKALVCLNIAHIYYLQKRKDDSLTYLEKAKSFDTNDLLIRQKAEELELALAST